jgi:hypothetical protein
MCGHFKQETRFRNIISWTCEHGSEQVSMSRKGYSKIYFPRVIGIFFDKSIHRGKIFSNKIIRDKMLFDTILRGKKFSNEKKSCDAYS